MTDGGWLNDADTLPVFKQYHSNTGKTAESGWHTLGPLKCVGMKPGKLYQAFR